jgi:hypothetical protein
MFHSSPFYPRKTVPFAEGTLKADHDKKRFNIRDQNAVLKDFLREHQDAVQEILVGDPEDLDLAPVTRVFLCGRVRIEVPILQEEVAPDLICEECEREPAAAKCEACDQV